MSPVSNFASIRSYDTWLPDMGLPRPTQTPIAARSVVVYAETCGLDKRDPHTRTCAVGLVVVAEEGDEVLFLVCSVVSK
jgi:hypothetical protein